MNDKSSQKVEFDTYEDYTKLSKDDNTEKTAAMVSQAEIRQGDKKFTVYKVIIWSKNECWHVFRRYNEFYKLSAVLKKQAPDLNLKIPGKKLFCNNMDPSFIASRREGLDQFVHRLMHQKNLLNIIEVRTFFNLDTKIKEPDRPNLFKCSGTINLGPSERPSANPSDFVFLSIIGKGSFGKVYLAEHKNESIHYAIKVLDKKHILARNEVKHIMCERNVLLKNINHPFLVGLHYSFQTKDKLYFVLDFINGGELFYHLQKEVRFSEIRAKFYAAEIASALGYLHSSGIIYRDLKPENLLLDQEGHLVLTDFGFCKEGLVGTETTNTFCGTPEYLAPEIIRKEAYGRSVDWWCLGAVLYEMLFGLPPFYSLNVQEMYNLVLHSRLKIKGPVSSQCKNLLYKLLEKQSNKRLGSNIQDFNEVKKHSFFKTINWDDLLNKRITPPFQPQLNSTCDLQYIDPQFTKESVSSSMSSFCVENLPPNKQDLDNVFAGFSYTPPSSLE
ncbi:Hypothetical protein CINCED_3A022383 [Cinara cedri]|nr:Hypothetical protein CINCED_3A022383 [Cinara cedri]